MDNAKNSNIKSNIKKSDKRLYLFILIWVIISIVAIYLIVKFVFFILSSIESNFYAPPSKYIYSNKITIINNNTKNVRIINNTLIILNQSYRELNITIIGNTIMYLNLSGNYDTINIFSSNLGKYALNLNGNSDDINVYNATQIGLVVNGVSDTYVKHYIGGCTQLYYQYALPQQKKVVETQC